MAHRGVARGAAACLAGVMAAAWPQGCRTPPPPQGSDPPAATTPAPTPTPIGTDGSGAGVPGGIAGSMLGGLPDPDPSRPPERVGGRVKAPRKLRHVEPVLPEAARQAGVEGIVLV